MIDVILAIEIILETNSEPTASQIWAADFNGDDTIDIIDVILMVNQILGG